MHGGYLAHGRCGSFLAEHQSDQSPHTYSHEARWLERRARVAGENGNESGVRDFGYRPTELSSGSKVSGAAWTDEWCACRLRMCSGGALGVGQPLKKLRGTFLQVIVRLLLMGRDDAHGRDTQPRECSGELQGYLAREKRVLPEPYNRPVPRALSWSEGE